MTCRELADFIAAYLSGELPPETRAIFDHHLSICPNCRTYLASYSATKELGRRAFEVADAQVPADVPDDLVQAILASRKR
jgi:anti-sigma factor RsiW